MKKQLLAFSIILLTLFSAGTLLILAPVYAAPKDAVCEGAGLISGSSGGCAAPAGSRSVADIVKIALNLFSSIIGIIAVVMIMIGGVKYITSQGESAQVASAKNTVLYAAIGLVVVALAQFIVRFVISRVIK